jgi:hypothetical protein
MQTFTEIVAAVVVSSSAAAYSHFGVTLDTQQVEKPVPVERTVARTVMRKSPAAATKVIVKAGKATPPCPEERLRAIKV